MARDWRDAEGIPMTKPARIEQWGWWSDGFGWQPEDTALVVITLAVSALFAGLAICARIGWIG